MGIFLILWFRWQTETYGQRPLASVTYLEHKTCVNAQTHTHTTPQVARLYVLTVHISIEISRGMHCTANRCSNSSLFIASYLTHTHTLFQTLSPPDALCELYVLEEACACVFVHACLYMWKGGGAIKTLYDFINHNSVASEIKDHQESDQTHCWPPWKMSWHWLQPWTSQWLSKQMSRFPTHALITWGS